MGLAGYAFCMAITVFGCGLGLKCGLAIASNKINYVSTEHILGEAIPHLAYVVIGIIFISEVSTEWQHITMATTLFLTAIYLVTMIVYSTTNHACSKHFGTFLAGFHSLRFVVMAGGLTILLMA